MLHMHMMYFGHTNPLTLLPDTPRHVPLTTPCPLVTHSPLNPTSAVHMRMGSGHLLQHEQPTRGHSLKNADSPSPRILTVLSQWWGFTGICPIHAGIWTDVILARLGRVQVPTAAGSSQVQQQHHLQEMLSCYLFVWLIFGFDFFLSFFF